jgi:hypothetical protein
MNGSKRFSIRATGPKSARSDGHDRKMPLLAGLAIFVQNRNWFVVRQLDEIGLGCRKQHPEITPITQIF